MNENGNSSSIKTNIILNTVYQVLIMIIPFLTTPYVSRVLGAEGTGIYSYTYSIEIFFSLFAVLGTQTYGIREISRNRDDKELLSTSFWEIELLTVFTTFIVLIAWMIFIICSKEYKTCFLILSLYLFNSLFDISWLYGGLEQFKYSITKNSVFKILGAALVFIFVKDENDLYLYIAIMAATTLIGTLTMWIPLRQFVNKLELSKLSCFRHFKEVLVYFIPTIATSIYTILDKSLIGIITKDPLQNGYYEQATKVINMIKAITFTSLNTVLGARISYLYSLNRYEEIKTRIRQSVEFILLAGIGFCFGIIGVAHQFVPWFFGDGYNDVIYLLQLQSPIIIIIGISNCLGFQYYNPAGLRKKSALYIIIGSFVNLILNLLLIPFYNSTGAIIASLVAELVITTLYVRNCEGYLLATDLLRVSWKKIIAGAIMLATISLIDMLELKIFYILMIKVILGIIVYIGSLTLMHDYSFFRILRKLVKK